MNRRICRLFMIGNPGSVNLAGAETLAARKRKTNRVIACLENCVMQMFQDELVIAGYTPGFRGLGVSDCDPPPRASDEYVVSVFDQFAASYDEKLATLSYQGPQIVAMAVSEIVAPGDPVGILDAGCGTGLCGPLLRPFASTLDGVDLSGGMVEKAQALQVYDELVVAELVAFMRTRSAAYDVVVSADTLNYFGDLVDPIAATETCLCPEGWLVFTLEAHAGSTEDYSLNAHGRYSHSQDYIESVLTRHGYDVASIEHVELRVENKVPVDGLLITARLHPIFVVA